VQATGLDLLSVFLGWRSTSSPADEHNQTIEYLFISALGLLIFQHQIIEI